MGTSPKGIIMYTPDGFMSAQLSKSERKPFATDDWFKASEAEFKDEATSYIAYTGPFHVDAEKQHLAHPIFIRWSRTGSARPSRAWSGSRAINFSSAPPARFLRQERPSIRTSSGGVRMLQPSH
jgi:hypothetical protein